MRFFQWLFGEQQTSCPNCERLQKEKDELSAKLFAEIDSNRLRENELLLLALQSAKIPQAVGQRTMLSPTTTLTEAEETELSESNNISPEDEQLNYIVQQFIDEADRRGMPYTQEARVLLREMVYRSPERFV